MKFVYRKEAVQDLEWFKHYYSNVFPDGSLNARRQYRAMSDALLKHPHLGHIVDEEAVIRELTISRTPFSLVYHITNNEIVILRLLDNRAERPVRM